MSPYRSIARRLNAVLFGAVLVAGVSLPASAMKQKDCVSQPGYLAQDFEGVWACWPIQGSTCVYCQVEIVVK